MKQLARGTPFEVSIYPHVSVGDLSALKEQLSYEGAITVHEPAQSLPLKWFEAHPCVGKRILCWFIEPEGANEMSLVIAGNTWNFRESGRRTCTPPSPPQECLRAAEQIDTEFPERMTWSEQASEARGWRTGGTRRAFPLSSAGVGVRLLWIA